MKKNEVIQNIARIALSEIRDKGIFRFSLDTIAKKSGVSIGTIYNIFSSKEGLLVYLHNHIINSMFDLVLKLEKEDLNLREMIICTTCFQFYIRTLYKDNSGLDLISTNKQLFDSPKEAEIMKASMEKIIGYRRNQLLQGITDGKITSSKEQTLCAFRKITIISRGAMVFSNHVFVPWGTLPISEVFDLCDLVLSTLDWDKECQTVDQTKIKVALRSITDLAPNLTY